MTIRETVPQHSQGIQEALKVSPPLTVLGSEAMGANVQNWILWATLLYTILLIAHKAFQFWKEVVRFRNGQNTTIRGDLE